MNERKKNISTDVTDGCPQADGELGRIMITDSSDWTDVRKRTGGGKQVLITDY